MITAHRDEFSRQSHSAVVTETHFISQA